MITKTQKGKLIKELLKLQQDNNISKLIIFIECDMYDIKYECYKKDKYNYTTYINTLNKHTSKLIDVEQNDTSIYNLVELISDNDITFVKKVYDNLKVIIID